MKKIIIITFTIQIIIAVAAVSFIISRVHAVKDSYNTGYRDGYIRACKDTGQTVSVHNFMENVSAYGCAFAKK